MFTETSLQWDLVHPPTPMPPLAHQPLPLSEALLKPTSQNHTYLHYEGHSILAKTDSGRFAQIHTTSTLIVHLPSVDLKVSNHQAASLFLQVKCYFNVILLSLHLSQKRLLV